MYWEIFKAEKLPSKWQFFTIFKIFVYDWQYQKTSFEKNAKKNSKIKFLCLGNFAIQIHTKIIFIAHINNFFRVQ